MNDNSRPTFSLGNPDFYPISSCPPMLDVHNLTRQESRALAEISYNKDMVVHSADKGGTVVILDAELYRLLNVQMLSDDTVYKKRSGDPTATFSRELKDLLQMGVMEGGFPSPLQTSCLWSIPQYLFTILSQRSIKTFSHPRLCQLLLTLDLWERIWEHGLTTYYNSSWLICQAFYVTPSS